MNTHLSGFLSRTKLAAFLCAMMLLSGSVWAATIATYDFEAAGGYTITTGSGADYSDGSEDYFTRTDGSNIASAMVYNSPQGSFFFAASDMDGDGEPVPGILVFDQVNISGYNNLAVSLMVAEDDDGTNEDWDEADDRFLVEYQIDGGGYQNLFAVDAVAGAEFNNAPAVDTDFDGYGDGTVITDTFATFNIPIVPTGSTLDLRVTIFLNSGDEDIAFDNVIVTGDLAATGDDPNISAPGSADAGTISVNTTTDFNIVVTNDGASNTLDVTNVAFGGTDASLFSVVGALPTGIAAGGGTANVVVRFTPGATPVSASATATITSTDQSGDEPVVTLTGVAQDDPEISVPASQAFAAEVGSTDSQVVTITNIGIANPLSVTGLSISGDDAAYFTITSPGSLPVSATAGGGTTDVTIEFDPQGEVRTFSASLDIVSDDANDGSPSVALDAESSAVTIFYKDFEDLDLLSGGWTAYSAVGAEEWIVDGFGGSNYGYMTGFNGGTDYANEDWLISPSVDFDAQTGEILSFSSLLNYDNGANVIELLYSSDYIGSGDPNVATWNSLTIDPGTGNSWTWVDNEIDVSAITGTNYIAFKYTSIDGDAATWEIDDILLAEDVPAIDVANIAEARTYADDVKVRITGPVVVTMGTESYRNRVYVQDTSGDGATAILIDDTAGNLDTVAIGDVITNLEGMLATFGVRQLNPSGLATPAISVGTGSVTAQVLDGSETPESIESELVTIPGADVAETGQWVEGTNTLTEPTAFLAGTTGLTTIRHRDNSLAIGEDIPLLLFDVTGIADDDEIRVRLAEDIVPLGAPGDPYITMPAEYDFGIINSDDTIDGFIDVNNAGADFTLNITGASITGADAANFSIIGSPTTVAPGGSRSFRVQFDPQGAIGSFTASLEVTSNATNEALTSTTLIGATPTLASGDVLIISQICDGDNGTGGPKFVEITNVGDTTADLSLYTLKYSNNGAGLGLADRDGSIVSITPTPLDKSALKTLAPGASMVILGDDGFNEGEEDNYNNIPGIIPFTFKDDTYDSAAGNVFGNGDDAYGLFKNDVLIDIYGDGDLDGTGEAWEYVDSTAYRVPGITAGQTTWVESEWVITSIQDIKTLSGLAAYLGSGVAGTSPQGGFYFGAPAAPQNAAKGWTMFE